jgi:hypothetical protein
MLVLQCRCDHAHRHPVCSRRTVFKVKTHCLPASTRVDLQLDDLASPQNLGGFPVNLSGHSSVVKSGLFDHMMKIAQMQMQVPAFVGCEVFSR